MSEDQAGRPWATDQYSKALQALEEAIATDDGSKKSRDSILLSYIFTFEMAVKCMRVALAESGMDVPDYAAAILRAAFKARLISDSTAWEELRAHRNSVSHAYDETLAMKIAAYVRQFAVPCFRHWLETLRA